MNGRSNTLLLAGVLAIAAATVAPAAEPVGTQAAPAIRKSMSLATLLGPGEFLVVGASEGWVEFRNVKTRATARYRMGAGSSLDTGRRIKVTKEDFQNAGGTGSDLNCGPCRKECTIVSTGSDPGTGDDTVSCVCISPDGRACR